MSQTDTEQLNYRSITRENPYKICFVCLGNICRSPTAEGIFQHLVYEEGLEEYFEIDSAGTSSYHIGESPNTMSQKVANGHGVELNSKARQLEQFDLEYFDLLLAMDQKNYSNVLELAERSGRETDGKIALLRAFDPEPEDGEVPDPYFGGMRGFEKVFDVIERSCSNLLDTLQNYVKS